MNVSKKTIEAVRLLINGDAPKESDAAAPYRKGTDIIEFFSEYAVTPEDGSRWFMTESCLAKINTTDKIKLAIEKTLRPVNYVGQTEFSLIKNVSYLNEFLELDGYQIQLVGKIPKVSKLGATVTIDGTILPESLDGGINDWLNDNVTKCNQKLISIDYSGAITNARSMIEGLFIWILKNTDGGYDESARGDLDKLRAKVFKRLNIEPENVETPIRMMISGLNGIIRGLAGLRNSASDAHGTHYRPEERHAMLAVNSAITIVNYFSMLCRDKNIIDKDLKRQHDEEEDAYNEAMADMHAADIYYGK